MLQANMSEKHLQADADDPSIHPPIVKSNHLSSSNSSANSPTTATPLSRAKHTPPQKPTPPTPPTRPQRASSAENSFSPPVSPNPISENGNGNGSFEEENIKVSPRKTENNQISEDQGITPHSHLNTQTLQHVSQHTPQRPASPVINPHQNQPLPTPPVSLNSATPKSNINSAVVPPIHTQRLPPHTGTAVPPLPTNGPTKISPRSASVTNISSDNTQEPPKVSPRSFSSTSINQSPSRDENGPPQPTARISPRSALTTTVSSPHSTTPDVFSPPITFSMSASQPINRPQPPPPVHYLHSSATEPPTNSANSPKFRDSAPLLNHENSNNLPPVPAKRPHTLHSTLATSSDSSSSEPDIGSPTATLKRPPPRPPRSSGIVSLSFV